MLVDTSAAIALIVADHEHHAQTRQALTGRVLGLAGHAAFECFSVLTRLPPPARLTASAASRVLAANFPKTQFLSAAAASTLFGALPGHSIAGGSVYDALVGACAREHGMRLCTRDRRALDVYRALDVDVELLS